MLNDGAQLLYGLLGNDNPVDMDAAIQAQSGGDSQYCSIVVECDDARNCNIALDCGGESARAECTAQHEQIVEEQDSDECVPLWTSSFQCNSTLSCVDFGTPNGDEICSEELIEEFGEELFDECGVPY